MRALRVNLIGGDVLRCARLRFLGITSLLRRHRFEVAALITLARSRRCPIKTEHRFNRLDPVSLRARVAPCLCRRGANRRISFLVSSDTTTKPYQCPAWGRAISASRL